MSEKQKDTEEQEDVLRKLAQTQTDTEVSDNDADTETQDVEEQLAKEKDKFLRLFAEFENYKKRVARERIELFKTANQDVVQALLPVVDDFERALIEIGKVEDNELFKGVELISNKLKETLKSKGLENLDTKEGDSFDADIHEAVTQIPAPSEELKGKIVDVIEKGYKLGDRIIRYPKVIVGQ
ncbi:nucleotide exchange factor GrpE [Ascidiimonas sp. W6]|uniref:nucleotide exchange factor GrpE n=1 Tax=Ascidiimonas meishanensis TaxID=3128903 RepID=UPI0030EE6F6D